MSWDAHVHHAWGAAERRKSAAVLAAIGVLHLLGWSAYLLHEESFRAAGGLPAAGSTAYLLGLRHVLALVAPNAQLSAMAVLSLPLLFAAGMCTVDSVDGMLMSRAYTWSLAQPLRRLWVNVTTTALTVLLAALVAVVLLCGLLTDAGVPGLDWVAALDDHFELLGYLTLALFLAVWGGAAVLRPVRRR